MDRLSLAPTQGSEPVARREKRRMKRGGQGLPTSRVSREEMAKIAADTVALLLRGDYETRHGESVSTVSISEPLRKCVEASQYISADLSLDLLVGNTFPTEAEVLFDTKITMKQHSTLQACREMSALGPVAALNFASARNPGGGFIRGSSAQEESLARSSGLYASLTAPQCEPYYLANSALCPPLHSLYTSGIIHSPNCPVFKDDTGALLAEPYLASFLTCPAPNVGAIPSKLRDVEREQAVFYQRAAKLLGIAAKLGHKRLILGAWGTGVFRNRRDFVAGMWLDLLKRAPQDGGFRGQFREIHFAILDSKTAAVFYEILADLLQ